MKVLNQTNIKNVNGGYQPEIIFHPNGEVEVITCTDPR